MNSWHISIIYNVLTSYHELRLCSFWTPFIYLLFLFKFIYISNIINLLFYLNNRNYIKIYIYKFLLDKNY